MPLHGEIEKLLGEKQALLGRADSTALNKTFSAVGDKFIYSINVVYLVSFTLLLNNRASRNGN